MSEPDDRDAWLDVAARLAAINPFAIDAARELIGAADFDTGWAHEAEWLRRFVESGQLERQLTQRFGAPART